MFIEKTFGRPMSTERTRCATLVIYIRTYIYVCRVYIYAYIFIERSIEIMPLPACAVVSAFVGSYVLPYILRTINGLKTSLKPSVASLQRAPSSLSIAGAHTYIYKAYFWRRRWWQRQRAFSLSHLPPLSCSWSIQVYTGSLAFVHKLNTSSQRQGVHLGWLVACCLPTLPTQCLYGKPPNRGQMK